MLSKPIKAINTEVEVFTSTQYGDVQEFQDAVNAWLKNQPNNIVIEDIIYRHATATPRGKDILSVLIISRPIQKGE